jgi:SAM-dependent methyltransferase
MGAKIQGDEIKLRRVLQIVADTTRRPLESLRVLDLACHEGIYAIEFARHGARVVGVEGREAHIEKARFVKETLSLNNLDIVQDDVRNLSEEKYGRFDVVLCLGILYHLDVPDVFSFVERIGEVCQDIAIIDTRIAFGPTESCTYKGTKYWGHRIREGHSRRDTPADKIKRYWASLDNLTSFHLSRTSLYSLLGRVGFTSVYECYIPAEPTKPIDRITLVAMRGRRQRIMNSPLMEAYPVDNSPEDFTAFGMERIFGKFYRMSRLIPEKMRIFLKTGGLLGRLYKPLPAAIGRKE